MWRKVGKWLSEKERNDWGGKYQWRKVKESCNMVERHGKIIVRENIYWESEGKLGKKWEQRLEWSIGKILVGESGGKLGNYLKERKK